MPTLLHTGLLLLLLGVLSPAGGEERILRLYGPGGPLAPMQECAELFARRHQVQVIVVAGPESRWLDQARKDADLIFGGAEYMLTQWAQKYPGLIDEGSRTSLYVRPAAILVRPGNPKGIRSLADLARPGLNLLDVNGAGQVGLWEDLAGAQGLIPALQKNIRVSVTTTAEAIEQWRSRPELDAWITFESWHHRLKEETEVVRLPVKQRLYRGTPIALASSTRQPELARMFVEFFKTPEAHALFRKWGWK
jgi:accessory colonization factor AcfC